jgi:hypothetical protein
MGLKATRMPPQKHILTYKNIKMKKKHIDFNNFFKKNNLYLII